MGMIYSETMSYTATEHPRRHRLTVADYYRMGEVGILAPDARVELIEGEIIDMAPVGSPHVSAVLQLDHLVQEAVTGNALVLVQAPIVLGDYSAPPALGPWTATRCLSTPSRPATWSRAA